MHIIWVNGHIEESQIDIKVIGTIAGRVDLSGNGDEDNRLMMSNYLILRLFQTLKRWKRPKNVGTDLSDCFKNDMQIC